MVNIFKFLKSISDKRVIFFGTGEFCVSLSKVFPFHIEYYVDNCTDKWDMKFMESKINSPECLKGEDKNEIVIIITSMYYESIANQLELMDLYENIHFFNGIDIFSPIFSNNNYFIDDSINWNLTNSGSQLCNTVNKNISSYVKNLNEFIEIHNKKIVSDREYKNMFLNMNIDTLDFMSIYSLIYQIRPQKYVQLGKGNIEEIINKSIKDFELNVNMFAIDCFDSKTTGIEYLDEKIYTSLNNGDILFINNYKRLIRDIDVNLILLDVLPKLKKGVVVHIYDSFFSYNKSKLYSLGEVSFENSLNDFSVTQINNYDILFPSASLIKLNSYDEIKTFQKPIKGRSLWLVKR